MEYILLLILLLVVIWVTWLENIRRSQPKDAFARKLLEQRIEHLLQRVSALERQLNQLQPGGQLGPVSSRGLECFEDVQRGWQAGQSPGQLAQRFGLHRQEVELILSLAERRGGVA